MRDDMKFSPADRAILLAVKGIGPIVVQRLEEMGYATLEDLAKAHMPDVVTQAAAMLGASCWKNSPQSRAAIDGAINAARTAKTASI